MHGSWELNQKKKKIAPGPIKIIKIGSIFLHSFILTIHRASLSLSLSHSHLSVSTSPTHTSANLIVTSPSWPKPQAANPCLRLVLHLNAHPTPTSLGFSGFRGFHRRSKLWVSLGFIVKAAAAFLSPLLWFSVDPSFGLFFFFFFFFCIAWIWLPWCGCCLVGVDLVEFFFFVMGCGGGGGGGCGCCLL